LLFYNLENELAFSCQYKQTKRQIHLNKPIFKHFHQQTFKEIFIYKTKTSISPTRSMAKKK